jgi:hypothetical protein
MSRRLGVFICAAIFLMAVLDGCKQKGRSGTSRSIDSVMINYQALSDSVKYHWNTMIADDDGKHQLMIRLLQEVSYTGNFDSAKYAALYDKVNRLKVLRYDQRSIRDSDLIDLYDSVSMQAANAVISFAMEHPMYSDFPLMGELIDDINMKNSMVLIHRVHYDSWVIKLNEFVQENDAILLEQVPGLSTEQMPIFQLPA